MGALTSSELNYMGSIAICPDLMSASGILLHEKVQVINADNGNRFETYVIEGEKGEIGLRGPAARLGKIGDKVIILSYAMLTPDEAASFKPKIVLPDEKNTPRP